MRVRAGAWLFSCALASLGPGACSGGGDEAPRGTGGAGGDASAGLDGAQCWPGSIVCQGACTDPSADPKHCGGCGKACPSAEVCSQGACAAACATGVSCSGACVDTQTNPSHCGACGAPCAFGALCAQGKCVAACPSGSVSCAGGCVDVTTSDTHCGTCGNKCLLGACLAGKCHCEDGVKSGSESDVDCGGSCLPCAAGKACQSSSDCKAPLACAAGTCATTPPSDADLVGFWRFEGNGEDSSGKGQHGALNGASLVPGKVGQGLSVAAGKCLTVPDSAVLDMTGSAAFAMLAWVQTTGGCAPADRGIVLNKENSYEVGIECSANLLQEAIMVTGTPWSWSGTGAVGASAWHHVALSWDGSTVRHYVDGAEVFSRALSGALADQASGLGVGCRSVPGDGSLGGAGSWFVGVIDEVALYRRALSPSEISLHYQATK